MTETTARYRLDGSGPLYRQIKRAIAEPILSGRYAPGTRLPSEHALTEMFDTSRMTVNRALQMLADDGLIVRRRRSGTFVASQVTEHTVMELRDVAEEIEESGGDYGYRLLERRHQKADRTAAARLGIGAGARTVYLKCCHLSDGKPFVVEERFISLSAVPDAAGQSFDATPPGRWLMRNVPWTRAKHAILAVNAADDIAALLDIETGTACLQVERTTWLADRPVTFVVLTYPGNSHRLVGGFSPGA